jgi:hypothetical protein
MKRNKLFLKTLFFSFILLIVLIIGFKKIRVLFPSPEIGSDKLVGFSQYFGYPFYFDNLFFFFLIFFPVAIFLFLYYKEKK